MRKVIVKTDDDSAKMDIILPDSYDDAPQEVIEAIQTFIKRQLHFTIGSVHGGIVPQCDQFIIEAVNKAQALIDSRE